VSLVYSITQTTTHGWTSARTLGTFALAVVLLATFVVWELRQPEPLMRFGIFRVRTVLGANVAGFILGASLFAMFLMLTLYAQQVLGYSPLKTGFAYLTTAGSSIAFAGIAAQLVTRVGAKPVMVVGMASMTVGLLLFTQVSVDGTYVRDLLPGFLVIGFGIPFAFVPITIAALAGVRPEEAGLASGLINTAQQIGGAVGVAALSTIANDRTRDAIAEGTPRPQALVDGFQAAFVGGAILAALGVVVALTLIRREELEQVPTEAPAST
jgi:predicted MFS family arabinose efflux permease